MIEGISDKVGHCLCKFHKLFVIVTAITCDKLLRSTVCSYLSPFIVVTSKEKLKSILEILVLRNHFGNKVAMIVDNRHILCIIVVKLFRCFVFKHKIVVDKTHFSFSFPNIIFTKYSYFTVYHYLSFMSKKII